MKSTRLLSLVGSGGGGKTRLAIEYAAGTLRRFQDGAWMVELASLGDGSHVVPAIGDVFEIREQPGVPLLDSVIAHPVDRQALLILDICEHLVDACADVVLRILASCQDVRALITTRGPLHVPGGVLLRVPPLALPDLGQSVDLGKTEAFDS